ncbi:DUF4383 domain-containing protein [Actinophytocola sp.]|uniref:DUF4383 domain-containing protein n=1 Tax=Actinophytocola sp. TaxID=1872138 RepID=UPI002ED78DB6
MVNTGTPALWDPGRVAVGVVAAVFFLAGVLGLVSGASFGVPVAAGNDAVHLALGVTGLAMARSARGSRTFLIAGGVVYFLWHYGGAIVLTNGTAPISLDTVNDWLNLWLAVSMIALACLVGDRRREPSTETGRESQLSLTWREVRASTAGPTARPRRPRPAAGSRPPAPGRSVYF